LCRAARIGVSRLAYVSRFPASGFSSLLTPPYRVQIQDECITAYQDFSRSHGKTKYIIYKIADNKKEVVVDSVGKDQDYEVFREELANAKDSLDRPAPRFAVYDVEYELPGEGKRCALHPTPYQASTDIPTVPRSSSSPGCLARPPPS